VGDVWGALVIALVPVGVLIGLIVLGITLAKGRGDEE
jgi:hypothetical protein